MLRDPSSATSAIPEDRDSRRQRILDLLRADPALERMADELADLPDGKAFGPIEYTLRDLGHELAAHAHQAGLDAGKKKGYMGSSVVCPHCQADARFVNYRPKDWLTVCGLVSLPRAYYHRKACGEGHCPFDRDDHLPQDELSAGLRPLVCLAGALASFEGGSDDLLGRFAGVRLSESTVRRATEDAGEELAKRQRGGDVVTPPLPQPWDFSIEGHANTAAFLGLDAFSVPIQKSGGGKAESRMIHTAVLYTPDESRSHYLVDFDLDRIAAQMREASEGLGLGKADEVIAITDGGNGLREALRRNFWDDLRGQAVPGDAGTADERRKLIGYFEDDEDRADYPTYLGKGWDIGSGPTEAACKVVGSRLKGSGMRWLEEGAASVAPLRALYQSGTEAWDAFWDMAT